MIAGLPPPMHCGAWNTNFIFSGITDWSFDNPYKRRVRTSDQTYDRTDCSGVRVVIDWRTRDAAVTPRLATDPPPTIHDAMLIKVKVCPDP
jgi:hypothetical protein